MESGDLKVSRHKPGRVQADHAKFWVLEVVYLVWTFLMASKVAEKGMDGGGTNND